MRIPTVIDVEASGFGNGSYPIEVGFVLPDGRSECTLIRPAEGWTHWDDSAEAVHGINRSILVQSGKPAVEVAARLNQVLRGMTVYSDAWAHDFVWLSVLYEEAGLVPNFKLEHLAALIRNCTADHWNTVRLEVEHDMDLRRHRASNDARVLQQTWLRVHQEQQAA